MNLKQATTRAGRAASALAIVGLTAAPLLAQSQQQQQQPQHREAANRPSGPATTVSAEKLSDNPENYYGQRVSVKEEVAEVLGPHLFTIEDGEFFGVSPDILVFAPNAEALPNDDTVVSVTGEVRKFTQADLEREYGWGWGAYPWGAGYGYGWYGGRFEPDYFVQYENRPYILARSIKTESGRELVNPNAQGEAVGTSGRVNDTASGASVGSLGDRVGDRVRLSNLEVKRVISKRGFWAAGQKGDEIFVALDRDVQDSSLKAGDQVSVAGRVMKAPEDKGRIDKSKWGLNDEDVTKLTQDRVFVRATAVRPAGQSQRK